MIQIDMGQGKPYVGVIFDGLDIVIMAPAPLGFMLEWPKSHVLRYAATRGWQVTEIADIC